MSKIKISKQTYEVLKNFETINKSIMIRPGNLINTRSVGQNVISEYTSKENFPNEFAIYELSQFLSGLHLHKVADGNTELDFSSDSYVTIHSENCSSKYYFSDPSIVQDASPPRKLKFPDEEITCEFNIKCNQILALRGAWSVYGVSDLMIDCSESGVTITAFDKENETNNTYSIHLQGTCTTPSKIYMKIENINLFPGDYDISITSNVITRWKNTSVDLVYYIATEPED